MWIIIDTLQRVATAVTALAERPCCSFLPCFLKGLSQGQIAIHLNLSRRTLQIDVVKAMLHCHQWLSLIQSNAVLHDKIWVELAKAAQQLFIIATQFADIRALDTPYIQQLKHEQQGR